MERVDRKSCSSENRPLDRIFAFSQGTVLVLRALFGIGRKEKEREREKEKVGRRVICKVVYNS